MSSDERPLPEPSDPGSSTEPLSATEPPAANAEVRRDRWSGLREPARRHPIGAALGAAGVGLVVGMLGGLAIDAHPMMSLTVGTAPYATQGPGQGAPAPRGHGGPERGMDPAAPPPPPGRGHGDGERGPGGPPPPPGFGPGPERGPGPGSDSGPRPPAEDAPPSPPGPPAGSQDQPGPDRGRAEQPAPPTPRPTA